MTLPAALRPLAVVALVVLGAGACGSDADESPDEASSGVAEQLTDQEVPDAETLCEAITAEAIDEVTGVDVVEVEEGAGSCLWTLTESAAALGGPNDDGEASLEASFIAPDELEAARDAGEQAGVDVVQVDDVGDDAFLVRRDGTPPSTMYVLVGDEAFSLALANVLDGAHATEQALTDLATLVIASL